MLQNIWAAFYLTKYMGYRPDCLLALGYRWVMPWCSSDVQDVLMFHWCTGFPDVPVMHRMPWCSSDVSFCWNQSIFILPWLAGFLLTIFCLTFVWPLRVWWIFQLNCIGLCAMVVSFHESTPKIVCSFELFHWSSSIKPDCCVFGSQCVWL